MKRWLSILAGIAMSSIAAAAIQVQVTGPGGSATRTLPDGGGNFDVDLPLVANSVNQITISATDASTNRVEKNINITQLSLDQIVVSQVTTERLPPERVVELVNQGVINVADPENFNVSTFNIVLTIGGQRVPISTPIVMPIQEMMGFETIRPQSDPGSGGGGTPNIQDTEIVVFELSPPSPPGIPAPRIYGVIVMEGRIKSLKEFYSVRLLLMNTSGIFTLKDVMAQLTFPDGGLSHTLPSDGFISFGDILPGDGGKPGQKEREFIIRGDELGVRRVKIDFGGTVAGPGLPEENPIAFNGTAESSVEVKGPPSFLVTVIHPPQVFTNEPYNLVVEIQNTGELPALYASFELEVGADAQIENCIVNTNTLEVECSFGAGPVIRTFGHILPGEKVRETYRLNPLKSGPITSCLGISGQNIQLQVAVGNIGCLVGQYPPTLGVPEGLPVVNVAPMPNQLGVSPTAPVSAFFSELMNEATLTTGEGGTFNVLDPSGAIVNGGIRFVTIGGRTVAIWQRDAGFNILDDNTRYEVVITSGARDLDGNALFNPWRSWFRTTSLLDDQDPPELTMTILPPVDPNLVLPGQLLVVNAYASDQGTGIRRVELRIKSLTDTNSLYALIDQKTVFDPLVTLEPSIFTIDTASLTPGDTYQLLGTAFDVAGNARDSTLAFVLAPDANPPVITLPPDPTNFILRGVSVPLTPSSVTGAVRNVQYFLNDATNPVATVFLAPWQTFVRTLDLAIGVYTVKAVAVDALLQTGEDTFVFELVENLNEPQVGFGAAVNGGSFVTGSVVSVLGYAEDPVGIRSVGFYLNSVASPLLATNLAPFTFSTAGLATGTYRIILLASNNLGIANNVFDPQSYLEFNVVESPPGPPPPAPVVNNLTDPDTGTTAVTGTSIPGATVTIVNTNQGFVQAVIVATNGVFTGNISANGGDGLRLTVFHAPTSPSNSAPTLVTVPVPPVVTNLLVTPGSRTFTAAGQFQDFVVTAQLVGGGSSNVTARSTFSSSSAAIASVNQAGRMVAQNNGIATLTATFKTNTAQAAITVNIVVLTNFTAHSSKPVLVFPGDTAQITVTGQYSNGTSAPLFAGVSYGAQHPAVATINGSGLITAQAEGSANFSVGVGGLPPKTVSVGVTFGLNPPPTVSFVSPAPGTLVERGQTFPVNVQAVDPTGGVTRVILTSTGELVSSNEQVFTVTPNTTRSFSRTVPVDATLGGTITFRAWAVDVGGLVSTTQSLSVTVADLTAPAVSILAPTNGQSFNAGSTVTVVVASSDAVGVGEVRYTADGALSAGGAVTNAFTPAATNSFSFIVPPGASIPDVYLSALARDAAGNERTSTPVQIVLTGADITPPATIITAASAPGSSVSNILSYTVTDGFADLAYVQVYFRRNGIGTFNLYTETSGTNILGRFFPQSGTNGTVVFDSTRMGGDGFYEFYSVAVDQAGNREAAPVSADQTATFNVGTVWVEITASTNLSATDFSLDNVNLRISNAVVTIEGAHTFRNVELLGTSRITHAEATVSNEPSFNLTLWSLSMTSNASINVTGRGYLGGQQPGNPFNEGRTTNQAFGSSLRAGGSHGGIGGIFSGSIPGPLYGNLQQPTELGSGGGSRGDSIVAGGDGGGRIRITAINIAADGAIRADGNTGNGWQSGGGSGGSIFLVTRTLSGLGLVTANGGGNEVGGGGGRVSVQHTDISTKDTSLIRAIGFDGTQADGGNGTVFLKGPEDNNGTLMIDGLGVVGPFNGLPIPVGVTFDHIILRNNARVVVDDPIVVRDSLEIQTGAVLTHSTAQTNGLHITANRVVIDATSAIDVTGRGYRGGYRDGNNQNPGETLGGQTGAENRVGGSHGGLGGDFSGLGNNLVYGSPYDPVHLGAGGGSRGDQFVTGGNGGGRITIVASNGVTVHGAIRADGQPGNGWQSGGGAGGSIKIEAPLFFGTGSVTANGGGNEVGGGGGRILIDYDLLGLGSNNFGQTRNITASGFKGSVRHGSSGTVLLRQSGQMIGDLILDATTTNATAQLWSPLTPIGLGRSVSLTADTLTLDGAVTVLPGGLVGLTLRPNVNASVGFIITDNTASTITVAVNGPTNLLAVAVPGDEYAAEYRFDNVILRRGAWVVTSDRLIVNQAMQVTENSVVTHYTSKTNYLPGLDIVAGQVFVASNSALNADGRGYLGGQQPGNPFNEARTLDNALGSTQRAGGSHGGIGGQLSDTAAGSIYGSITTPDDLGAGGGSRGDQFVAGGNGGGRIRLVAETVTVHGAISAGGANGLGWNSGSGAGGSILISASAVEGDGILRANGGVGEVAGAGGRVALYYTALGMASSNIQARGGDGTSTDSGHGTVFLKTPAQALGTLVIDGANITSPEDSTPLPPGYVFDQIVFRNRARVLADVPVVATDTISLLASSRVSHTRGFLPGLVVTSANVIVDSTSAFDASAKGYRGGQRAGFTNNAGETVGSTTGSTVFSGGSYGGLGASYLGGFAGPTYGVPVEPVWFGSGGSSRGDVFVPGGNGGGRVTLMVSGTLTIDGLVLANGQAGLGWNSGGGSGGSILVHAGTLAGSGGVLANGGGNEVGGGGGRIAIFHTNLVMAVTNIAAIGGAGFGGFRGGNGTVLLMSGTQTNGDLIVDGYGFSTPSDSTPMPTNVVFDNVIFRNGARIQLVEPLVVAGSVQVTSNSVLTHARGNEAGLRIEAQLLFIGTNSSIDVSGRGYRGGQRDGNTANTGETTNNTPGSTVFAGGSHGGLGGQWSGGVANPTYGSVTNPVLLGSGGSSRGDAAIPGGNGGGRIALAITGGITNDGRIVADGQAGSGFNSGGGSGGSIKISADSLSGGGTIEADGGGNEVGGGGGRIAIYVNSLAVATNRITAAGGIGFGGGGAGSAGTVYLGIPPGPLSLPSLNPVLVPVPAARAAWSAGSEFVVVWDVATGVTYAVQYSPHLIPASWTTIQYLVHPVWTGVWPSGDGQGFLRIQGNPD